MKIADQEKLIADMIQENHEVTIQGYFERWKGAKIVEKLSTKDIVLLMGFHKPEVEDHVRKQQRRDCLKRNKHDMIVENEKATRPLLTTRASKWK